MTYTDKVRIATEVAARRPAPPGEPDDCAAWRASLEKDYEKMAAAGIAFDLPCDWEG